MFPKKNCQALVHNLLFTLLYFMLLPIEFHYCCQAMIAPLFNNK